MRRFLVFINPISGTKSKQELMRLIEKRCAEAAVPMQFVHTNAQGHYPQLLPQVQNGEVSDIIVCGGDGTVNQVSAALLGVHVPIGIIPMGSGNGLALSAGIPKDPNLALDIIFKGRTKLIDGFFINEKFSCMLCGLGFDAKVAHEFAKQNKRGLQTYVKQTLKEFTSAPGYRFTIELPNTTIETNAFFITVANSNQFGNNVTIAPMASLNDGLLDVVIVKNDLKVVMMYHLLQQVLIGKVQRPGYNDLKNIHYYQTDSVRIINHDMAPLHIDGDPMPTSESFDVQVVPSALQLICPPQV